MLKKLGHDMSFLNMYVPIYLYYILINSIDSMSPQIEKIAYSVDLWRFDGTDATVRFSTKKRAYHLRCFLLLFMKILILLSKCFLLETCCELRNSEILPENGRKSFKYLYKCIREFGYYTVCESSACIPYRLKGCICPKDFLQGLWNDLLSAYYLLHNRLYSAGALST